MRFESGSKLIRLMSPFLLLIAFATALPLHSAIPQKRAPQPIVLSVQIRKGAKVYRLNGRRVENSVQNSILTNLGRVVRARGTQIPALIIIDVRAPFSEVGKLETALEMSGITRWRIFVTNFKGGIMNEIHWDDRAVPLPPVVPVPSDAR